MSYSLNSLIKGGLYRGFIQGTTIGVEIQEDTRSLGYCAHITLHQNIGWCAYSVSSADILLQYAASSLRNLSGFDSRYRTHFLLMYNGRQRASK